MRETPFGALPRILGCFLDPFPLIFGVLNALNHATCSMFNRFVYALLVKPNSRFVGLTRVDSDT